MAESRKPHHCVLWRACQLLRIAMHPFSQRAYMQSPKALCTHGDLWQGTHSWLSLSSMLSLAVGPLVSHVVGWGPGGSGSWGANWGVCPGKPGRGDIPSLGSPLLFPLWLRSFGLLHANVKGASHRICCTSSLATPFRFCRIFGGTLILQLALWEKGA